MIKHNAQQPKTYNLKLILISIIICGLLTMDYGLIEAAELTVPADVRSDSVIFNPLSSAPGTCNASIEGRIYYNNAANNLYYCNGTNWEPFGAGDYRVATKIVSAYNSYGATRDGLPPTGSNFCIGDGSSCDNPKADYTCTGKTSSGATPSEYSDTQVIQRAIDELPTAGGVIYLLEGTYKISSSINLTSSSGVAIIGAGMGTLLNIVTSVSTAVLNLSNAQKIVLSGLMIKSVSGVSCDAGILVSGGGYSMIERVWVENMRNEAGGAGTGIRLSNSRDNIISDSVLKGNYYSGIWLDSVSTNNIILRNQVLNTSALFPERGGICLSSSDNNTISQNTIQNTYGNGIRLNQSNSNLISNNNLQNNAPNVGSNPDASISLDTSSFNVIYQNNVQNSGKHGLYIAASAAPYSCGNIISGNNIQSSGMHGLYLDDRSDRNCIIGNSIHDNGNLDASRYNQIKISFSSFNLISSNFATRSDFTGWGIYLDRNSSVQQNYLAGNYCGYISIYDHEYTNSRYTDSLKMTLEQKQINISSSTYALDAATYPRGYAALNPTATNITLTLVNGKTAGDLLILENISASRTVSVSNSSNTKLSVSPKEMSQNDTLTLFWNGNYWLEAGRRLP